MAGARVYIITTAGPALIQSVRAEQAIPGFGSPSAVCLNHSTKRLPITKDYQYLLQDHVLPVTGPGHYRIDVDRWIEGGDSWKLAVWAAHWLHHQGLLAMDETPDDHIVLVTGDIAVAVEGFRTRGVEHLPEKVARARSLCEAAISAGKEITFVAPAENADTLAVALASYPARVADHIRTHAPATRQQLIDRLLSLDEGKAPADWDDGKKATPPDTARPRPSKRMMVAVGVIVAAVMIGGAVLTAYDAWRSQEETWADLWRQGRYLALAKDLQAASVRWLADGYRQRLGGRVRAALTPLVTLEVGRSVGGEGCRSLRFRESPVVWERPLPDDRGEFVIGDADAVCAFRVTALQQAPKGSTAYVWITAGRQADPGELQRIGVDWSYQGGPIAGGGVSLQQRLPPYRHDAGQTWHLALVAAPTPSAEIDGMIANGQSRPDLAPLGWLGLPVWQSLIILNPD